MEKIKVFKIVLLLILLSSAFARSVEKRITRRINPAIEFRASKSDFESVHDEINNFYYEVQNSDKSEESIASLKNQLAHFQSIAEFNNETFRSSRVSAEDKEFLQNMLDRINSLIDELEKPIKE